MSVEEQKAEKWFQTGSGAVGRRDFDYAIKCFDECCKLVPSKLIYRQALRGAQRKKHGDNGTGVKMAGMRMGPARTKMSLARRRGKLADAVAAGEEALALNPWDTTTLYDVGCLLADMEHRDCAIWVLETAQDQKNAEVYRKLAELYEATEQFQKAIRAWEFVSKLDSNDENALSKIRQLAASETIQKGKYSDTKSDESEGVMARPRTAAPETFESRLEREIKEAQTKLEETPDNPGLHRDIAENYKKLGNIDKAIEAYSKAVELTGGNDIDLQLRLKETQLEPYRRRLSDLEHKLKALGASQSKEQLEERKKQIAQFKAAICKREAEYYKLRSTANPDDHSAQLELGHRLLQLQQFDDAIKALQKGRADVNRRWQASLYLGVAFWRKKNMTLADRNLAEAFEAVPRENEEARKEILYYRARVAQDAGDTAKALENYNEIAAIDYDYKDVARRIDALNTSAG